MRSKNLRSNNQLETHPSTKLIFIPLIFFVALVILKYVLFSSAEWFVPAWRILIVGISAITLYLYISRRTTIYRLSSLEASLTQGIFSQSTISAPLNRVTNFELRRPFLKRIFGLADLMIDTPGSADIEIKMVEMNLADAEQFKNVLSEYLGQQKVAEASGHSVLQEQYQRDLDIARQN